MSACTAAYSYRASAANKIKVATKRGFCVSLYTLIISVIYTVVLRGSLSANSHETPPIMPSGVLNLELTA